MTDPVMSSTDGALPGPENSLLDAALGYVARGWYVIPLKTRSKQPPLTKHGVLDASNDPEQVRKWWQEFPTANIGVACGKSGLVVVDVDPRNGGDIDNWFGSAETDAAVLTGGEGLHLYYHAPDAELSTRLEQGVDLQRGDKYVVAPPSVHPNGKEYAWVDPNCTVQNLPQWIVDAATVPTFQVTPIAPLQDYDADNPMHWYNRYGDIDQLLEDHDYTLIKTDPSGERYWRRPGGTNNWEVTTNYQGNGTVFSFSPETPFPQDVAVSPFRAYSLLVHGGDDAEATRAIRDMMVPTGTVVVPESYTDEPKYNFEPAFPPGHFVERYIDYASQNTDAAKEYHEATAVVLLASVTYGVRLQLAPFPGGLQTNLYCALVGPSTRSRKSTAQQLGLDVLEQVQPGVKLANRISSEGAMYALRGRRGTSALWAPDEMGVALGEVYRREYLSALEELLLTLYGGTPYTYVTVKDTVTIDNVSMNVLGAATPESIALAGQRAALGGLLPRIGVVFPSPLPEPKPVSGTGIGDGAVTEHLRAVWLHSRKLQPLTIANSALSILNDAEYELTGEKYTARLPVMLYKVAACSALSQARWEIQESDADAAVKVIERWRQGAARLQPYMRRNANSLEFKYAVDDVRRVLRELGPTVQRPVLARELGMEKSMLNRVRDTLVDQARIRVIIVDNLETWSLQ